MSRPETVADLLESETTPKPFLTLHDTTRLLDHPGVGAILLEIKAKAKADGLIEESSYNTVSFATPLSETELESALKGIQRDYDNAKVRYEEAMAGGDLMTGYYYNAYTTHEGLGEGYSWVRKQEKLREEAAEAELNIAEAAAYLSVDDLAGAKAALEDSALEDSALEDNTTNIIMENAAIDAFIEGTIETNEESKA